MSMLTLKLKDGGELDIPISSILLLEEGEEKTIHVVYTLDRQSNISDLVTDNYGFVKKKLIDGMFSRPLEVTKKLNDKKLRIFISEDYIVARRDHEGGTRLTLNVNGPIFSLDVLETRKQLDGED